MSFLALLPNEFGVLEISGRDAGSFLQSQLATDLRSLADTQSLAACALAANGRVLAAGTLLRRHAECFWWVLHRPLVAGMQSHLQRFVLRSKLRLSVMADLTLCSGPETASEWPRWRDPAGRDLGLAAPGQASPLDAHNFTMVAICCGWLDFAEFHRDRFLPQMLGLHRFGAIALDKGCYPGQEIVARTHYLGRVKRELRLLETVAMPAAGCSVLDSQGQAAGECLSVVANQGHWLSLAVVEARVEQCCLGKPGELASALSTVARSFSPVR